MQKIVLTFAATALAAAASAYTVYDAGKALRQNCASGAYTGANGDSYYTDENGGKWQYRLSNINGEFANVTFQHGEYTYSGKKLAGFAVDNTKQASSVRVNISGTAIPVSNGEPVEPDELILFPANSDSQRAHVRFIAPEAGWYSAFVSAHDIVKEGPAYTNANSGVNVIVLAQGDRIVSHVVSLEDVRGSTPTHRFDFQMPVRHLAAGDAIDVLVGRNGGNSSDNTGVKFFVTKEDEGRFYDSGIAMTNNLATVYTNAYGTIKDGTWYYMLPRLNVATGAAFKVWAPLNFSKHLTLFTNRCTRAAANNQRGFASDPAGYAPYMIVNETEAVLAAVASQELHAHPHSGVCPTLRFRPPEGGYYSASVVVRDVGLNTQDPNANGVWVALNVADHVVDSAYVSLESFSSTARLTFDKRLVAAGEPIDVIIMPCVNYSSDPTAFSVIIRREQDVYDAGKSFYAHHAAGNLTHPFPDALNDGATWDLGAKTNAWCGTQFWSLPAYKTLQGTSLCWWVHSASGDQENGNLPRIAMATNGVASGDSYYVGPGLVGTFPYEFFVHPNNANLQSSSPTLRAVVPADGIYHARCYARDLSQYDLNGGGDGIRLGISVGGRLVPDLVVVSRDLLNRDVEHFENAADGDRLWLKAGDTLEFVVDPYYVFNGDSTGLTACYAKEGDVSAETRVVNVHFTESGTGKFSATAQRPREGWASLNKWNALRPGSLASASVRNCYEADGTTQRNLTVTLTRDSGTAIAKGTGEAVFFSHVSSSGTDDTYTFTVGNLKKNEPYTLYLYSVKSFSSDTPGNATFSVGGVTKGVENTWICSSTSGGQKVLTRFDVTSDANGTITGTFAAADANGGAFNGLTLVGDLPAYVAAGATIIVR
ncbi:MAG: hypothetical protein IJL17_07665 [Kiritimatiellae bacterium]|nr:hypothetical protein [Kiritimatiellia bacterium]